MIAIPVSIKVAAIPCKVSCTWKWPLKSGNLSKTGVLRFVIRSGNK